MAVAIAITPTTTTTPTFDPTTTTMTATPTTMTATCKRRFHEDDEATSTKKQRLSYSAQEKKKRVVRFQVDSNNQVPASRVHLVARIPATDAPRVWYTLEDFRNQRRRDAYWMHVMTNPSDSEEEGVYRQSLLTVLGMACGKVDPTSSVKDSALVRLVDSPLRGLEREMSPCFRQRKKQVVANVLRSQQTLVTWKKNNNHVENKSDGREATDYVTGLLASHYQKLAAPAARFARLLGEADARLVLLE